MIYSVAIPSSVHDEASDHLLRKDRQEDLCFALWYPSTGANRQSACIAGLILPEEGEREVHGNVSFTPEYFERAVGLARQRGSGLALLHSHLGPGWQDMSPDDIAAESGHAPAVFGATGLPFVGLTLGTDDAWSGRFWPRKLKRQYERHWCESVRVVGSRVRITFNDALRPKPAAGDELIRTISAWGETAQADLTRMRIGIVGAGSVGAIVAETLARMGISHLTLIDFDVVERHNLDRLLHATRSDAAVRKPKVQMLAARLPEGATAAGFKVEPLQFSVVEETGFRAALDCDVLFCCVDRPWGRFVLNFIAYAHLIPVVDGGIQASRLKHGRGLKRATWKAHMVGPGRRCLECLGQYDPSYVSLERSGMLDDPRYIESLPTDHELRTNENVFGFSISVAGLEIEHFLRAAVPHPGHPDIGAQTAHLVTGMVDTDTRPCEANCPFCTLVAKGDRTGITDVTGRHPVAEQMRAVGERRKQTMPSPGIIRLIKRILGFRS